MTGESGRVVRRGRIRVDARKAITKLRDHLLVDLHLYAVEVVRAGVLAGASRIDVTYDADDVIIAFDGRALAPEELPRLFEHLTGGEEGDGARSSKLLALAVNAALGLAPAWISLTTASSGAAARVTWTPALVAAIEREDGALPEPEVIAAPPDMPATGTRFQLRRKVGWEVVRRAAARTMPRELALLVEAAVDPRVPLFVQGAPAASKDRSRAVARAAFSAPGARSAHVEITRTTDVAPHVDHCELGLLLARASFAFGRHFPVAEHLGVAPPVRIVIDADALPTNASRSAVREDTRLVRSLQVAAAGALTDAIAGVVAALTGRGAVPEGVTVETGDRVALEDALGVFLCGAEASLRAQVALPDALRSLLDVPLFRDGLGRPMSRMEIPAADPLLVWTGKEPVPPEMEPWARAILWPRGEPPRVAERLLAMRDRVHPERLDAMVKRGADRRRKLLAAPAGEVVVPDDAYLCRRRFAFDEGPLAGLAGEVAVAASPSEYVRNLGLRVFLEGRCFQTFPLPEANVPLPCVIALQWEGHIAPAFAYEGVEPNEGVQHAIAYAVREAVLLCEDLAARGRGAGSGSPPEAHSSYANRDPAEAQPFDGAQAAVLRSALATAVLAAHLPSLPDRGVPALADLPGLVDAPIWPTTADRFASLQTLGRYAARTGAVCVVAPGTTGDPPDDRPVVRASSQEIEQLRVCLRPDIQILRYDAALMARAPAGRVPHERMSAYIQLSAASASAPVLRIEAPRHLCLVTLGQSEVRVWHGAAEVAATVLDPGFGGATIAIDDDTIVPTSRWDGVLFAEDQELAGRAERAFAERLVAALLGDEAARAELSAGAPWQVEKPYSWPRDVRDLPVAVRRYLIDRAARGAKEGAGTEDAEIAARIRLLPILTMIGPDGEPAPASLSAVSMVHPAPFKIPCLRSLPPFKPVKWRPVIVGDEAARAALLRWSGGRLQEVENELSERLREAGREQEYQQFLQRPIQDVAIVGPRGDAGGPAVFLQEGALEGVAAALPAPEVSTAHAMIEVLLEGRLVGEEVLRDVPIPIVGRLSTGSRSWLEGMERLSPAGKNRAAERMRQAAQELAMRVVERASSPGAEHTLFRDLRALRLVLSVLRIAREEPLVTALCGGKLPWPTVQGASRPWGSLLGSDGQLWTCATAYASWIPGAPATHLDRPILHVPRSEEGAAIAGILEQLAVKVRDVTGAIEALQAKRAKGNTDRPRLAERPAHPALARDLERVGILSLEGEVALYESGEPLAEIHTLDGETRRMPIDLPFPARAVARTDVLTPSSAAATVEKLALAAIALLTSTARSLDDLPPFVRAHLRALVCREVSKEREPPASACAAPIFADVDGGRWSLEQLREKGVDWSCTVDPPPYPKARQEGRTLVLTAAEHRLLHPHIRILNATEWMRRDLEAERRREGPQVEQVRFDGAAREHMLSTFEVSQGSLTGEIGLLRPGSDGARGIQVLYTRRPLCRLDDAPGWPIAAVLSDDTVHPDRWFTKVWPGEETRLRSEARRLAGEHMRRTIAATLPPDRRADVFIDALVPAVETYGSTAPMAMTGILYLPATWPERPSVCFHVQGVDRPFEGPVMMASAPIAGALPIGGTFFVAHGEAVFGRGAAGRVALALRSALERLVAPLAAAAPNDPELVAYLWNLRLLGGFVAEPQAAIGAGGEMVTAPHVLAALEKGEIWLTDRRGSIEGAFPGGAPPFVLLDEPSPLVRVLRARLPDSKLRVLGGQAVDTPAAPLAPPSMPPPEAPDITAPAPPESKRRPARSWLGAVLDRVSGALSPRPGAEPPPTEIAVSVERALRALRLRDEPVIVVREARRGKLLRYDRANRVVTINIAHPALAQVAAAPTPASIRRACLALTAAAVTEVNIALDHVTDHDESEALLELLRQDAAAAAQARVV